jgi:hypothetical protein
MARQPKAKFKAGDFVHAKDGSNGVVSTYPGSITWEEPSPWGYGPDEGHYTYKVVFSEGQRIFKEHELTKLRKPKGHVENTGYRPCACRDCMETAIGGPGSYCHACEKAGCPDYQGQPRMSQECQAEEAYGGDEGGGKRRHSKPQTVGKQAEELSKLMRK